MRSCGLFLTVLIVVGDTSYLNFRIAVPLRHAQELFGSTSTCARAVSGGPMTSRDMEPDVHDMCNCPACWDASTGEVFPLPAHQCSSWRRAAQEWLWASSLDDMAIEPRSWSQGSYVLTPLAFQSRAMELSDEIWLMIFLFVSDDCPSHSLTALIEISGIMKRSASALLPRRAEHLRLLLLNLEADHQLDVEMEIEDELNEQADAFFETWSIDSDGHWHDRRDRVEDALTVQQRFRDVFSSTMQPRVVIDMYDPVELRTRRLELAWPSMTPVAPPIPVVPELSVTRRELSSTSFRAGPSTTPTERDASPMSMASTVPATWIHAQHALRPLPDLPARNRPR